jgi:hypothetical protein
MKAGVCAETRPAGTRIGPAGHTAPARSSPGPGTGISHDLSGSTPEPLEYRPFDGPRILGPIAFSCTMTDEFGTSSGIMTITIDVVRQFDG